MALWLLTSQKLGVIIYAQVRKFIFIGWNIRKNSWKRDSEFVVGSRELTFVGDDGAVIVDESKNRSALESTPTPWLMLILLLGKIRVNQTT